MTHSQTEALLAFVRELVNRPELELTAQTPLVTSGLIDSLSLVGVLRKLEQVTARRISAAKVKPQDLDSVELMLATAARLGKPRG